MRLDKILPLPISTISPARRDEKATERPKPPDADADDDQAADDQGADDRTAGRQTGASADDPLGSDGAPSGHIDITV